jgi:hypothetical protein
VLVSCLASACEATPGTAAQGRVEPAYDKSSGKLTRLAYDADNDGKHDTWAFMDGARLTRLEADENQDGRIDRWEFYPVTATKGVKPTPERIERSTRLDGQVSRREYFENGVMVRVEEDTDGNGKPDKWETYAAGALVLLALDTQGRGKPDRRLVYAADGSLERIETDPAGTGHFEVAK